MTITIGNQFNKVYNYGLKVLSNKFYNLCEEILKEKKI